MILKKYLAWLKAISIDEREGVEEEPEPPLPAGLKKLTASLQAFVDFFEIDPQDCWANYEICLNISRDNPSSRNAFNPFVSDMEKARRWLTVFVAQD